MLTVKAFCEMELFREWFNEDFDSLSVQEYISYDNHLILKNV